MTYPDILPVMGVLIPRLPCTFLLSAILWAIVSAAQRCDPQAMPDMVIDISLAVARGARFTDPINAAGVEECIDACCTKLNRAGDRDCNLVVYDVRKIHNQQNCYLFHCPRLESCPMTPSLGVLSYSLWTDNSVTGTRDSDPTDAHLPETLKSSNPSKTQSSSGKKSSSANKESSPHDPAGKKPSSVPSQGLASEVKHSPEEEEAETPGRITSQLLHLAENIEKHLEKIESKSESDEASDDSLQVFLLPPTAAEPDVEPTTISIHRAMKRPLPDAKGTKPSKANERKPVAIEVHYPTKAPKKDSHRLGTADPKPVPRTKANLIAPTTTSQDIGGADRAPNSDVKSTKILTGHSGITSSNTAARTTAQSVMVGHPVTQTETPTADTVQQTRPPPLATRPVTLRTSPSKATIKYTVNPSTSGENKAPEHDSLAHENLSPLIVDLQETPRKLGTLPGDNRPSLDDKSGLVAALIFGVVFLVVVICVVSRKVSEARRRHRYTKLDYLINGMYVDT